MQVTITDHMKPFDLADCETLKYNLLYSMDGK